MLFLQDLVKKGQQTREVTLYDRLPKFLTAPCRVHVVYHVEALDDFYLVHLHAAAKLLIQCQRCLDEFQFLYENDTEIAVCRTDERANEVLKQYECIVCADGQLNLDDLLIDELHLYAPQFHSELQECNGEIKQFLT